jgi:hypothetical protein
VRPGHLFYGLHYNDDKIIYSIDVHGGLTFSHACTDLSRKAWELFRNEMQRNAQEALRYPHGDPTRFRKEWSGYVDDYDKWRERREATAICHKTDEPDDVWWLGFDCTHADDKCPAMPRYGRDLDRRGTYRDVAYVTEECRKLAQQLTVFHQEP